jgi:hypothetical protein
MNLKPLGNSTDRLRLFYISKNGAIGLLKNRKSASSADFSLETLGVIKRDITNRPLLNNIV